jgi:predicted DNA-binding transcriptional regulator AlpA
MPAGELRESRLLTEDAVAEQLGCSPALLRKWRRVGGGPAFCRIGRLVRYSEADIAAYIDACRKGREG